MFCRAVITECHQQKKKDDVKYHQTSAPFRKPFCIHRGYPHIEENACAGSADLNDQITQRTGGGCIGGAGCLTHEAKDSRYIDDYGKESTVSTMMDALARIDYPVEE